MPVSTPMRAGSAAAEGSGGNGRANETHLSATDTSSDMPDTSRCISTATWAVPLAAMFGTQFAAAFPLRILPVLAPLATAEAGIAESAIGYLATLAAGGSMIAAFVTGRLVARFGTVATLQAAMCLGVAAAAFQSLPLAWAFAAGSILAGFSDGPTPIGGNDALQQTAPERSRNLLFSIKMLGGPLGGLAAGLALPQVASFGTWRAGPALAAGVPFAMLLFILATSRRWPAPQAPISRLQTAPIAFLGPIRALLSLRYARRLALIGLFLALSQGAWYTFYVSYLVHELGRTLIFSGAMVSVALGSVIAGRLVVAALADVTGKGELILLLLCITSGIPWTTLIVCTDATPDIYLIVNAILFGLTLGGWVGLQHAEIARTTPQDMITDVSSAAVFLMFLGLTLSGAIFALTMGLSGGYRLGFSGLAVLAVLIGIGLLPACIANRT